jgi:hypothetical protein
MGGTQKYLRDVQYSLLRAKYALRGNNFSHSGEQHLLFEYIKTLLPSETPKIIVDIGAGNGMRWSNSYALILKGWAGVGIEADEDRFSQLTRAYRALPKARAHLGKADPNTIGSLLRSLAVPDNFGVLSLDIDGNDYWVLRAILEEFRPGIVVTEINEKIPPPLRFATKFDPQFRLRHHFYGHSIAALEDLCEGHGYGILGLEYNNAFLAPREFTKARFISAEAAYRSGYLERSDRKEKFRANSELEAVHSLDSSEALRFLKEFYRAEEGRYYLSQDQASFEKQIQAE